MNKVSHHEKEVSVKRNYTHVTVVCCSHKKQVNTQGRQTVQCCKLKAGGVSYMVAVCTRVSFESEMWGMSVAILLLDSCA